MDGQEGNHGAIRVFVHDSPIFLDSTFPFQKFGHPIGRHLIGRFVDVHKDGMGAD